MTNEELGEKLRELLKCNDGRCQRGHYALGENEDGSIEWGGCPNCVTIDGYFPRVDPIELEKLILQALQEQRQSILEEITELESDLQGHMGYTAVERIKKLLKNN